MSFNKIKTKIRELSNNSELNRKVIRQINGLTVVFNKYGILERNGAWEVYKYDDFIFGFETIPSPSCIRFHTQEGNGFHD